MFSDDDLLERLVLKGGNALDLVHRVTTRASHDLDFSMERGFSTEELKGIRARVEHRLLRTFTPAGYTVFDVLFEVVPKPSAPDPMEFWGGYKLEFKVIDADKFVELRGRPDDIRRQAIAFGPLDRRRFEIDISKFEYCKGKQVHSLDGLTIYVYTPAMVVCEKLRAICQQMPEYVQFVKRQPASRARDFLDIHATIRRFGIDLGTTANHELVINIFAAKHVPLHLLGEIPEHREFHRQSWPAVEATVRPSVRLKPFDFYFDFVAELCTQLHAHGDV